MRKLYGDVLNSPEFEHAGSHEWSMVSYCLLISVIQLELVKKEKKKEKKKKKKHEMNRRLLLALFMSVSIHVRSIHFSYVLIKGSCYHENELTNMCKSSHIVGQKLFSLLFDLKANMTLSKAFYAK